MCEKSGDVGKQRSRAAPLSWSRNGSGGPQLINETPQASNSVTALPLSPIQQGFFAESLISEDKGVNVEQVIGELDQALDEARFRAAWRHAMQSFDALRIRLLWRQGQAPEQRIVAEPQLPFHVVDARDAVDANDALAHFLDRDRRAGFDLQQCPLWRITLLRLPSERCAFVWTIHHGIIDGGCYATVIGFVFGAYDRLERGLAPEPSKAPDFREFVTWLTARDSGPGVAYFTRLLEGFEGLTELPGQARAKRQASGKTSEVTTVLSSTQTRALEQAAKGAGATLNTLLQLAWALLLARHAGNDDVVFGATWSGRPGTIQGAESMVGPFINTLPVRVKLSHDPTVRQALSELRAQHLEQRPFHHTPLAEIKAASQHAGAAQLFNTLFVFEYERFFSVLARQDPRWQTQKLWSRSQTSYPLGLAAHVLQGSLHLIVEYDTGLYDAKTARRLVESTARLAVGLAERPDARVHEISPLAPGEYRKLTEDEARREQVPAQRSALERVFETADKNPTRTAVEEIGGQRIEYGELKRRVLVLARALRARGVRSGDIVGISLQRSIDAVVAMLAVHAAGGAFLPLDTKNPHERLSYMVEDSQAKLVLVNTHTASQLPPLEVSQLDIGQVAPTLEQDLPAEPTPPESVAYVIYTSGSTGQPKGVCIPHSALANLVASTIDLFQLTEQDRVLQFVTLSFDVCIEEIFPTLARGSTLVIRNDEMVASARGFLDAVSASRVTVLDLPTAFWHQLVYSELPWPADVRLIVTGGERMNARAHAKFRSTASCRIRLLNAYGPTETTVTSTVYDDAEGDHDEDEVPIGRPVHGHSHFALDRHLEPVIPGTVGQLYIGGAGLGVGYLRRPQLTDEKFVPHPWRAGARLYATGDLVRQTERGNYVYVDRVDHQVKVRGFRIELGEIEARLSSHPAVKEAVVVVQKADGQDDRLVAFAEAAPRTTTAAELADHLASTLPAYMIPSRIFVETELPQTPAGKVDRRALAQRQLTTAPPGPALATHNALERELMLIWTELLRTPVPDTQTSFFALGGNSLVAVQMFTLVEKRLGKSCNVMEFFKDPTVSALRRLIETHDGTDWKASRLQLAAGRPGELPLFFAPSVTGRAIDYVHLGEALGQRHPVHALQIRGLREGEPQHDDLFSAANHYADLMQGVQPQGPYAVIGFSAGGIIALAIAEVLHERGQETAFLGVLDSVPPVPAKSPFTSPVRFARLLRTVAGRVREVASGPDAMAHLRARAMSALKRSAANWLPLPIEQETKVEGLFVGARVELSEAEARVMQTHLNTILAYKPRLYPLDLVLFRTHLDPFEGPHEPDLGWSRAVRGRVEIDTLPCQHHELLTREGAPRLAALMLPHLARRCRPKPDSVNEAAAPKLAEADRAAS